MKTSNKLLLVFLIATIISTFVLLFGFKKTMKENKYTVVDYDFGTAQKQKLAAYKFVKLQTDGAGGYEDVFSCSIIPSGEAKFEIPEHFDTKLLKVKNEGDTLLIKYDLSGQNLAKYSRYSERLKMRLFLPDLSNISADGVTLFIDSVGNYNGMSISLTNKARLDFGFPSYDFSSNGYWPNRPYTPKYAGESTRWNQKVKTLKVAVNNSKLSFGNAITVDSLELQVNSSKLTIEPGSHLDKINGNIDKQTVLNGNSENLHKLLPLIPK